MVATQSLAGPRVLAPIRFQPLLPQPAHPGRSLLAWGLPASILEATLIVAAIWVSARGPVEPVVEESYHYVDLSPQVSVPEAPAPPEPPKLVGTTAVAVPDAPAGFQTLTLPSIILAEIPPPSIDMTPLRAADFTGQGLEGGRAPVAREPEVAPIDVAPTFTPYTVAPRLQNTAEIARALVSEYPPRLRAAGVGAQVLLWLFIDQNGTVQNTVLKTSSGFEAFDQAAMRVAILMTFTPAINRDREVPVWVAIPIDFKVVS